MTREEFEIVKQAGIDKWTGGAEQTEDEYYDWWGAVGRGSCSFCNAFSCDDDPYIPTCPLQCIWSGWGHIDTLDIMGDITYEAFIEQSKCLLSTIKSIEYNPAWGDTVTWKRAKIIYG